MQHASRVLLTVLAFFALVAGPGADARAGVDVDFGAAVRLGSDSDIYLAVAARYHDRDRDEVGRWSSRFRDPDDLAVALWVHRHSGRSLDAIWDLRRQRLSWWQISVRFGMPADVWFVPVRRDPGPPYGKAYGHWKKHRHARPAAMTFTDADMRNLVAVRFLHDYYGLSVEAAMGLRASGRDLRVLTSEQYRKHHGPKHTVSNAGGHSSSGKPGKGNGSGKGKGRR